jgi:hypothetical protein
MKVQVVSIRADRAHDCVVDEALRIRVVRTGVHVRGNVGDVEGLFELVILIVDAVGVKRVGVHLVIGGINAWKDWGEYLFDVDVGLLMLVCGVVWVVAGCSVRGEKKVGLEGRTHEGEEGRSSSW